MSFKRELEQVKGNPQGHHFEEPLITSIEPPPTTVNISIYAPNGQVSLNGIKVGTPSAPLMIEQKPPDGVWRRLWRAISESTIVKLVSGILAAMLGPR